MTSFIFTKIKYTLMSFIYYNNCLLTEFFYLTIIIKFLVWCFLSYLNEYY